MRSTTAALAAALMAAAPAHAGDTVDAIRAETVAVADLVESPVAHAFLGALRELPAVEPRTVFTDAATGAVHAATELEALDAAVRARLEPKELGERYYYLTRYGTPTAYVWALDIAARYGFERADGARILDFGYGGIGHLLGLASLGAEVTGVEVDPVLRALYLPDVGPVRRAEVAGAGRDGALTLVHGSFPGDDAVRAAVAGSGSRADTAGGAWNDGSASRGRPNRDAHHDATEDSSQDGYDLVISKNVLKRGYIHPEQEVDPRTVIDLGVDDARFVHTIHDLLKPGGLFVIANLCPRPNGPGVPYRTWADGRCPFARGLLETAGFEILAFDVVDDDAARAMGVALGWGDEEALAADLFARSTVLRKR